MSTHKHAEYIANRSPLEGEPVKQGHSPQLNWWGVNPARPASRRRGQAGFTLTELLVSLALGLTLVSGLLTLFMQGRRSAVQDQETVRLLENGRWALRHLSRELAMAGFWGQFTDGSQIGRHSSIDVSRDCGAAGEEWLLRAQPLQFLNDASRSTVAAVFGCLPEADVVAGSDIIAIKRSADAPVADGQIESARVYLRSDGSDAVFFQGGSSLPLPGAGAENWLYLPQVYYLRDYTGQTADGIPSLCRARLERRSGKPYMRSECLVAGIEDMQLEFGIDRDGDFGVDYYSPDPTAAELSAAVSVRFHILARSVQEVPQHQDDKTYRLGPITRPAAGDAHYRRVFSSTVLLRNPAAGL